MAIEAQELRRVMGHFATGVTVITTQDKDGAPQGLMPMRSCRCRSIRRWRSSASIKAQPVTLASHPATLLT